MDSWRPGASRAALEARARLFARIRAFFAQRGVLEVDTPLLARYGVSDPAIEPLIVGQSVAATQPMFLQSSPEFAMKRLLADGVGAIYQLGKAFRDGEHGARHNPEFTLLEWYRPGFSMQELMDEVAALVCECLQREHWEVLGYRELFLQTLSLDPWEADAETLAGAARTRLELGDLQLDVDGWLDLLMSHCVEPALAQRGLVFVCDYPPSQAALARVAERDGRPVAERFELYVDGVELANGYRELLDARELERRGGADNLTRQSRGQETRLPDKRLLEAMVFGLPDCSGVALGVDRLLLAQLGADALAQVMPFDWTRC